MTVVDDLLQEDIRVDRVLRVVPGKRLIGLAQWRGNKVILKLFFAPGEWKRHFLADVRGVTRLREQKVLTPRILHRTITLDAHGGVLLFSYIQQGINLGDLFERAHSERERMQTGRLAMEAIASCHKGGVIQDDIHLDNFMVAEGRVYVLDGGDIRLTRAEINRRDILSNLALFFAQFPVSMDRNMAILLQHYASFTAAISEEEAQRLPRRVIAARTRRLDKYQKKLFRSTTAHRSIQEANKRVVYDRSIESPDLEAFIKDPDSFVESGRMLKAGNSSTVVAISLDNKQYVLKRYNVKSFWHGIKRTLRPSRAYHSWRNAAVLEMLGVATPHPYLFMELRANSLARTAYYLSERIPEEDVLTQLLSGNKSAFESDTLVAAFDQLLRVFADYHISHGDMKASNFIYRNKQLYVLDLDAMRRRGNNSMFFRAHRKDRERLKKNWQGTWLEEAFQRLDPNLDGGD